MKTDGCREWRESLGAYALGHLAGRGAGRRWRRTSRAAPSCRAEARVAGARWRGCSATPTRRASSPAPQPAARARASGSRRRSARERRSARRRRAAASAWRSAAPRRPPPRRCWRSSSSPAASERGPEQHVAFARCRQGIEDRRDAGAARLRHRDPHVRARASARARSAASTCAARRRRRCLGRHLPLPLGRTTPTRCSAPPSTSRATAGDRRPRRQAGPSSRRSSTPGATASTRLERGGIDVKQDHLRIGAAGAGRGAGDRRLRRQRDSSRAPAAPTAASAAIERRPKRDRPRSGRRGAEGGGAVSVARASPKLGKILVDSKGFTLYDFHKDKGGTSSCYGACASVWPPLLTEGDPAGRRRRHGLEARHDQAQRRHRQVTYAGHPLYTYTADKKPGEANGNDITPSAPSGTRCSAARAEGTGRESHAAATDRS